LSTARREPYWAANDDFDLPEADVTRLAGVDPSIFARRAQRPGDNGSETVEIAQKKALLLAMDDLSGQLARVSAALRGALPQADTRPALSAIWERAE
jgi:hypothetical protein